MEFTFQAQVQLTLEAKPGDLTSKHISTDFNLDIIGNLDHKAYIGSNNLPTKEGSRVLSTVLIHGLIGNIHYANDNKFRDSAEHLRYIIAELEKGFATVATSQNGTFK